MNNASGKEREAFDALISEFENLRSEIQWLVANGMRYQQFGIAITIAGLSATTFTISKHPYLYPPLGFALSAVLSWLGILYYWEHVEIHVVAGYIQEIIRPKVCKAANLKNWWEWEEYKNEQWKKKKLGMPNLFRWRLLSFCIIAALFALTSIGTIVNFWCEFYGNKLVFWMSIFLLVGALILLFRLAFLGFRRSNLSDIIFGESQ